MLSLVNRTLDLVSNEWGAQAAIYVRDDAAEGRMYLRKATSSNLQGLLMDPLTPQEPLVDAETRFLDLDLPFLVDARSRDGRNEAVLVVFPRTDGNCLPERAVDLERRTLTLLASVVGHLFQQCRFQEETE